MPAPSRTAFSLRWRRKPRAPGPAVEQTQHVPRHAVQTHAVLQLALDIGAPLRQRGIQIARRIAEEARVDLQQHRRVLIGGAAQHHAIDMVEMRCGLIQGLDAAIEDDLQRWILALHAIDQIVIQRRHVAVLFRRQALQPGLAGMHGEAGHARRRAHRDQGAQTFFGILVVHADAAFDGYGHGHRFAHGRHAIGDQRRFLHQAGAEAAGLHAVGRAADIQIDFVIAEIFGDARCFGQ